jgi:retron-type reverse transcriptase
MYSDSDYYNPAENSTYTTERLLVMKKYYDSVDDKYIIEFGKSINFPTGGSALPKFIDILSRRNLLQISEDLQELNNIQRPRFNNRIIDNSNPQEPIIQYFNDDTLLTPIERRHGLPIGNLTSQFFANIYLSPLDHFIKEELRCKAYVRYVDDFALFSDDVSYLGNCRQEIENFLAKLRLKMHPIKSQLFQTKVGASFLGFRIFPHKIRVRNNNLHRGRRRLRNLQKDYAQGKINIVDVLNSLNSWQAHLEHGDTWRLRQQIFNSLEFKRD